MNIEFIGKNSRKLVKTNCYSRLSSNEALKSTKNKTMRQLNSVTGHYKKENMVSHDTKSCSKQSKKSKGHKSARSPKEMSKQDAKRIVKQLGGRMKSIQQIYNHVHQKSLYLRAYENKMIEKFELREKELQQREQEIENKEQTLEQRNLKGNQEDFKEIIKNIRSMDTKPGEIFESEEGFWDRKEADREDPFDTKGMGSNGRMEEIGPDTLRLTQTEQTHKTEAVGVEEAGTWMTNKMMDREVEARVENNDNQ